jgi:hypothetical protein
MCWHTQNTGGRLFQSGLWDGIPRATYIQGEIPRMYRRYSSKFRMRENSNQKKKRERKKYMC